MADDTPSQKQISGKYQGNLGYLRHPHYLRRFRLWAFLGVALLAVLGVAGFRHWGKDHVFSPGPISESHASLADNCRQCHAGVETSVFAGLPSAPKNAKISADLAAHPTTALSGMDDSCRICHPTMGLHLPQASRLGLSPAADAVAVVRATGCAACHREHVGRSRIAMPERQSCLDCHNDEKKLKLASKRIAPAGRPIPKTGENRDLGDGLMRFLSPPRAVGTLKPFSSYADPHPHADRHPPFDYEHPDRRDPARLAYNHERHLRDDIPKVQGHKLACADCHTPGPGGTHHQPVNYESHCQQCHSLHIHSDLPELLVPHGDPQKTRYFLTSLKATLEPADWKTLEIRGLGTLPEMEKRVFGDSQAAKETKSSRPKGGTFITECAKCHHVTRGGGGALPIVAAPNIADRWVQHGPFTHLPHQHIACIDCHVQALKSEKTEDILLPPQTLCAKCHRPSSKGIDSDDSESLAARQVKIGGIKSDCQGCHTYHAPPNAAQLLEALLKPGR